MSTTSSSLLFILLSLFSTSTPSPLHSCPPSIFTPSLCPPWSEPLPASAGPWSHPPFCAGPTWAHASPNKAFCVYNSAKFNNGAGITLFTTPAVAKDILASKALDADTPHLEGDAPYEEKDMPGRGRGLVATRKIERGETILVGRPSLVITREAYTVFSETDQEYLQWKGVLRMPASGRNGLRALAKQGEGDEVVDLVQTNGFVQRYGGDEHVQVVVGSARVNHACRPNAFYRFDNSTMTQYFWALRDIAAGEEITTTYLHETELSSKERKRILKETWGFECTCSACAADADETRESDKRLAQISMLRLRLQVTVGEQKRLNATKGIEKLLKLYDAEGLVYPKIEAFAMGAHAYREIGREDKAVEMAERAREWWRWAGDVVKAKRMENFVRGEEE